MDVQSPPQPNRKQLYREFLRRFDPGASPGQVLKEDLIEASLSSGRTEKMGAALLLKPGTQLLLVGGIGSGKSTECQLLQQWLATHEPDVLPIFLDVSKFASLEKSKPGSILLSIALHLLANTSKSSKAFQKLASTIRKEAHGYVDYVDPSDSYEPSDEELSDEELSGLVRVSIAGRISKPAEVDSTVADIADLLKELCGHIADPAKEIILILDGMDRLMDPLQYWEFVDQDFSAIKRLGFSLASTAPLSLIYDRGRDVLDHFSQHFHITPIAPDAAGAAVLTSILSKRRAQDLLSESLIEQICLNSGGVLRDLISLVETAAQNAYLDDQDHILKQHVDSAILQLGDSYMLGLSERQRRHLRISFQSTTFLPSRSEDLKLLLSRRVLERAATFEVHPALLRSLGARHASI